MATREAKTRLSDEEIADKIHRDMEFDGHSFRLGQFVGLMEGRVVAVADTLEEVWHALDRIDPRPGAGFICIAEPPVPDIIR